MMMKSALAGALSLAAVSNAEQTSKMSLENLSKAFETMNAMRTAPRLYSTDMDEPSK